MARGLFITFEGGEGAGKSTQIKRLSEYFEASGERVEVTREPGGSPGAEAVRHVILSGAAEPFGAKTEALLFAAARADHVDTRIRPAVEAGRIVLCDRYIDSTRVYQGATGSLDAAFLQRLERLAIGDMMPDLTLILDIDPRLGMARANARRGEGTADRFEKEALKVHRARRQAFLTIAEAERERCVVIDASRPADEVAAAIWKTARERFPRFAEAEAVADV